MGGLAEWLGASGRNLAELNVADNIIGMQGCVALQSAVQRYRMRHHDTGALPLQISVNGNPGLSALRVPRYEVMPMPAYIASRNAPNRHVLAEQSRWDVPLPYAASFDDTIF